MKLLYLLLLMSFGANAAESYALNGSLLSAMDAHSRSFNLKPLNSSGTGELRIWSHDYMGRRITGYVISGRGAMKCKAEYRYTDGSITIEPKRCRRIWLWHSNMDAIAALDTIRQVNGKQWDCPMLDGGTVYIDGIRNGERISLRVGNPWACDDENSKAVLSLLGTLPK